MKAKLTHKKDWRLSKRNSRKRLIFKNFADKLEIAMKGICTDYKAIKEVFKAMENDTDIIQLKKAFGLRGESWFSDDENLNQWIQGDLSSREIKEINALLETKGITFKF